MNTTPTIRTAVALVIVIAGVAVIGFIPYSRWKGTRDRGDFERARTPLVRFQSANCRQIVKER